MSAEAWSSEAMADLHLPTEARDGYPTASWCDTCGSRLDNSKSGCLYCGEGC